jgi:hypothetical protein
MFTQNGIVGASGGSPKFVLKSDGTATFAGTLSAATGSFGSVTADSSVQVSNSGYISSANKTSYTDSDSGFWFGYDSSTYKVNIGDSTKYIKWTGSDIEVSGNVNTSGYVKATGSVSAGSYSAAIAGIAAATAGYIGGYFDGSSYGPGLVVTNSKTGTGAAALYAYNTATSSNGYGIDARSRSAGAAVYAVMETATGTGSAIYADSGTYGSYAGEFHGNVKVTGLIESTRSTLLAPISCVSSVKCNNLNADLLDGYHAGNANGNIPISNGTTNTNLYAQSSSAVTSTVSTSATCGAKTMRDFVYIDDGVTVTDPGGTGFAVEAEDGWMELHTNGGRTVKIPFWL